MGFADPRTGVHILLHGQSRPGRPSTSPTLPVLRATGCATTLLAVRTTGAVTKLSPSPIFSTPSPRAPYPLFLPAPFSHPIPPSYFLSGIAPFLLSGHSPSVSHLLLSSSPPPFSAPPTLRHRCPPAPVFSLPPGTGPLLLPMSPCLQAPTLFRPRRPSTLEHRPSLTPYLLGTVRPNKRSNDSFGLFGQTEGFCLAKQDRIEALFSAMAERLYSAMALVRPVWPNGEPLSGQTGLNEGPLFDFV